MENLKINEECSRGGILFIVYSDSVECKTLTDIYYNHDIIMISVPFTAQGFFTFNKEVSDDGKK